MVVDIRVRTEQLTLDAARKLLGWKEASRQGKVEDCRQIEAEYFLLDRRKRTQ